MFSIEVYLHTSDHFSLEMLDFTFSYILFRKRLVEDETDAIRREIDTLKTRIRTHKKLV